MFGVLIALFFFLSSEDPGDYLYSVESPHGNYTADLYLESPVFAAPGQGGESGKLVTIIVKNSQGSEVARTTDECSILYGDLELHWLSHDNSLQFGRSSILDLNTGRCLS